MIGPAPTMGGTEKQVQEHFKTADPFLQGRDCQVKIKNLMKLTLRPSKSDARSDKASSCDTKKTRVGSKEMSINQLCITATYCLSKKLKL